MHGWLEKALAPHCSTLAWKILWMEEPGRLQSTGSLRVRHDWATSLSLFTFMHWRRKWQPTPVFLPGESQGQGSLVAAVYGVTQGQARLKWLSSMHEKVEALKRQCAKVTLLGAMWRAECEIKLNAFSTRLCCYPRLWIERIMLITLRMC